MDPWLIAIAVWFVVQLPLVERMWDLQPVRDRHRGRPFLRLLLPGTPSWFESVPKEDLHDLVRYRRLLALIRQKELVSRR